MCLQPLGEEYHLRGSVVAVAGIVGAEATETGVGSPQNIANFTGSDDPLMSHQYRNDVEIIVEAVDGFECSKIARCKPGMFVIRLDPFGNGIEGVSEVQGGAVSFENAPDMAADMEGVKVKQSVTALEFREEQLLILMSLGDGHEACPCLCRVKLGRKIIAPIIIVFQVAKHRLQQDGVFEVVK